LTTRDEVIASIARGLCRTCVDGPGCLCERRHVTCVALEIYLDMAMSAVRTLEREGFTFARTRASEATLAEALAHDLDAIEIERIV
jgi:hypothetical protein